MEADKQGNSIPVSKLEYKSWVIVLSKKCIILYSSRVIESTNLEIQVHKNNENMFTCTNTIHWPDDNGYFTLNKPIQD